MSNQPLHPSKNKSPVVIIIGPTAAGKTDLSFSLAKKLSGEIINADVGQFYTSFSVGVAKPDWKKAAVPCHLFDILDQPIDLNVVQFRDLVSQKINDIMARGKVPILVGGSHFYVQSLFYPPISRADSKSAHPEELQSSVSKDMSDGLDAWSQLNAIDPVRAAQLHPHDTYRIDRALAVWHTTGQLPSSLMPVFQQEFPALFVVVNPEKPILTQRIALRAAQMLKSGEWLQEVKQLLGTAWEPFMLAKLIGYKDLVHFLRDPAADHKNLETVIQQETWQYAKRQKKFIRRFLEHIEKERLALKFKGHVIDASDVTKDYVSTVVECFNNF